MGTAVNFSLNIHAAPVRVSSNPSNGGALTLCFSETSYPDITIFCESAELARDLHAVIERVIKRHAAAAIPFDQKEQGARCGCGGSDDYCACQNVVDEISRKAFVGEVA